ncbi:hypothetical protein L6452_22324 [Arctium lappa]|uniref:Uncharacterized protein n=1 Tax=Arctium lappa TaxID=4217 RepID=A0ACB9B3S5_ARCLA|nr:hypothetical protein L6452_22324 [Arctium lappa]
MQKYTLRHPLFAQNSVCATHFTGQLPSTPFAEHRSLYTGHCTGPVDLDSGRGHRSHRIPVEQNRSKTPVDHITPLKMSNQLLSMGSQSKPLVLVANEYQQWKKRMIQFLNHKNREYMESITYGPVNPMIRVPGQAETETSPEIFDRFVPKPYQYFSEKEKDLYKIDEEALIYLTMAIPNDIYNRVDSRNSAKEVWDELARQFEGSEASI